MNVPYPLPGFDQPMSCMSHLLGAVLFFVLSFFLLRSAKQNRCFWYCFVFAFTAVVLLSISGVYHMFSPASTPGRVLVRLDVAAIFALIAGTFTPIHGVLFTGWRRWGVLVPLWTIAITGMTLRSIFFDSIPLSVGTAIFLLMGWIGALSAFLLWQSYGFRALVSVIGGGVFYSFGAVTDVTTSFFIVPGVWGPHETFHFCVLAGLGWHWALIWNIADGTIQSRSKASKR